MAAEPYGSRKSIYWESYIFIDDAYTVFGFIKERARQGVKVKVVLDSIRASFGTIFGMIWPPTGLNYYFNRLLPW